MGFFDGLFQETLVGGALGDLVDLVSKNPQILGAVAGLLSTKDSPVGGLGGLIGAFQRKGLGDAIASWISTGPNPPISATQAADVLGPEALGRFALKAGVPPAEAGTLLAGLLPTVIDKLTPDGKVPEAEALESTLGRLFPGLGR